ncbi:hypothetical protein M0P48_05195 [Candidatus Gracilibacteria bacterium]|jgi:uncharacterized membrane protein SirB2|nr:hypothetical protein [Candidatus Gracilibacteria bacterium]
MNNQNNKLNLIFSAIFFVAGGALILNPGIFPFLFATATWMIAYLFLFLCSIYLGILYIKKAPVADQKKFFIFHPLTITIFLAYLLVLASSFLFIANIVELFRIIL